MKLTDQELSRIFCDAATTAQGLHAIQEAVLARQPAASEADRFEDRFIAKHGHRLAQLLRIDSYDIADRDGQIKHMLSEHSASEAGAVPYEKRHAIKEGERNSSADSYFKARHEMLDTIHNRRIFEAGFDRGYDAAPAAEPNGHIDDDAVDHFAVAMKEKLAQARAKGRSGWHECDPVMLSAMLREHVEKGDPRDVANFCMFLWSLGYPIAAPAAESAEPLRFPDHARRPTQTATFNAATADAQGDYEALEREHMGDPDKRTGIYAQGDERARFEDWAKKDGHRTRINEDGLYEGLNFNYWVCWQAALSRQPSAPASAVKRDERALRLPDELHARLMTNATLEQCSTFVECAYWCSQWRTLAHEYDAALAAAKKGSTE